MTLEQLINEYKSKEQAVSVVVFCQEVNISALTEKLKGLEQSNYIKIIIQPCPYEGIEFLFRTSIDLPQTFLGKETDFFWQGLLIKDLNLLNTASSAHYSFLVAILQQDIAQLKQAKKELLTCISNN
ncbi:MAG TPA: hypothetical protein PKC21_06020 [Oligoflexia bacterium]|nr:hypothetical protein [Oligoflexia bacterium]HMR24891.1 hypothetical protein [Oligoflexia bacterium]